MPTRSLTRSLGFAFALATALAWPATPVQAQAERLATSAPRTTAAGATFTAPAGWSLSRTDKLVVLAPPEPDTRIAIYDTETGDAAAAVAAGWAAFRPGFNRPIELVTPQAPRDGWAERKGFDYDTSPNERRAVWANAFRAGSTWTVMLVDASWQTRDKRLAAIAELSASLRPKGFARETFAGRKAHPLDAARVEKIRAFVDASRKQLEIPGVAFGLVENGKVVYLDGLGVKELGKPGEVGPDTLFMAASNTKPMTTLLIAQLVDSGKLAWDQPVTSALPSFKLGDPQTTRKVLVKHLVCACTGLPRRDLEWLFEYRGATAASTMKLLAAMQPTTGFGEVYQYNNLMAAAAGYVAAAVISPGREAGHAYDEAMRGRVFRPLGMDHTTFDFAQALRSDHASPHGFDVDGHQALGRMDIDYSIVPMRPAGGVWTSARDLTRFVQMELAEGLTADGKTLVSKENLLARRRPQVSAGEDSGYGMGLFVSRRLGTEIVSHGGSMPGYRSDMAWLPEHGVGAVLLTNAQSGGLLLTPVFRFLLETLFDGRPEAAGFVEAAAAENKAWIAQNRKRFAVPPDPVESAKLAAHYSNPLVGELAVRRDASGVVFDFGEWRSSVASRRNEDGTLSYVTIDPIVSGWNFVVRERAGKRLLVLRDSQHEYELIEKRK